MSDAKKLKLHEVNTLAEAIEQRHRRERDSNRSR